MPSRNTRDVGVIFADLAVGYRWVPKIHYDGTVGTDTFAQIESVSGRCLGCRRAGELRFREIAHFFVALICECGERKAMEKAELPPPPERD